MRGLGILLAGGVVIGVVSVLLGLPWWIAAVLGGGWGFACGVHLR